MEGAGLGGQRRFFRAVFCAVVCHGKEGKSGGAAGILVAEFDRLALLAGVCPCLSARLGFHLRLRFHVDSLHSEPDHSPEDEGWRPLLRALRISRRRSSEVLLRLWCQAGMWGGASGERFGTKVSGAGDSPGMARKLRVLIPGPTLDGPGDHRQDLAKVHEGQWPF